MLPCRINLGSQCHNTSLGAGVQLPFVKEPTFLSKPGAVVKIRQHEFRKGYNSFEFIEKQPCWQVFHLLRVSFLGAIPICHCEWQDAELDRFLERLLTRVPVLIFPPILMITRSRMLDLHLSSGSFKGVFQGILVKQNSNINCLGNQKHMFECLCSICVIPAGAVAGERIWRSVLS